MPTSHSALKQLGKDKKRTESNRAVKSELKTIAKIFLTQLRSNQIKEAQETLKSVAKRYDQAAAKGVINPHRAAHLKSQFSKELNRAST